MSKHLHLTRGRVFGGRSRNDHSAQDTPRESRTKFPQRARQLCCSDWTAHRELRLRPWPIRPSAVARRRVLYFARCGAKESQPTRIGLRLMRANACAPRAGEIPLCESCSTKPFRAADAESCSPTTPRRSSGSRIWRIENPTISAITIPASSTRVKSKVATTRSNSFLSRERIWLKNLAGMR
jgi:hypothetical protein